MTNREMDEFEQKLKKFLETNSVRAEQILFRESVHSVEEAARALNASAADLIKSIVFLGSDQLIVAIVSGEDRVSSGRVGRALEVPVPRIATSKEVLKYTGYPIGGVPPFGYHATVLIDTRVLQKKILYGGGGSPRSLVRISPSELLRVSSGIVADIREEHDIQ